MITGPSILTVVSESKGLLGFKEEYDPTLTTSEGGFDFKDPDGV